MESFFQTNPKSAEKLYTKALDYVFEEEIPAGKVVMDLFCGTGTIGQICWDANYIYVCTCYVVLDNLFVT